MIIEEFLKYRKELINQSKDEDGFVQESLLLSQVLPSMLDAKLIDSEDANNSYFKSTADKLKVNAYCVNESGERLQLFMINESSIDLSASDSDLQISAKSHYESQFKRGTRFINKAIKGHLNDEIQDSNPARALISKISSSEGADQFDVIELFLISTTATINSRTATAQPLRMEFESEELSVTYSKNRERLEKQLLIKKRLIDLNFLHNVLISQGNREALEVDFEKMFGEPLSAIQAADEDHFESFLCVLPAKVIAGLYKEYSSRLLEKNVRSFLQFRGVNKGIRETIRKEPEKFVAYNNGLTITATSADIFKGSESEVKITSLTDFQIVNGGQTTCTIYFTQKDGFDISQVKVMAKINVAKETSEEELEELISNISNYSNAQSKVSKVDLRSRNPQLIKLKGLSESIITPSGLKWFFERAKGEYNTMLRAAGNNKKRIQKDYPTARKFSKELLAKYYCAWGEQPYLVKRGGEKVFRYFIEELSGEGENSKKPKNINRSFYEELIAKVILFKTLEKLYGQGKNSMGQLRSVVVPYSISVLYKFTDGTKSNQPFDLLKIWLSEKLEDDLVAFFNELLLLMNELVKNYSESDDYGEYSKKPELWNTVISSQEIKEFMSGESATAILTRYSISKEELKKRSKLKMVEVDFHPLHRNVSIHSNGQEYYKSIRSILNDDLDTHNQRKIGSIINQIGSKKDITADLIEFEKDLIIKIRADQPEVFDQIESASNSVLDDTLNLVIKKFNNAVEAGTSISSEFNKLEIIAVSRKVKYASVFGQIGKKLEKGLLPDIQDMYYATSYFTTNSN